MLIRLDSGDDRLATIDTDAKVLLRKVFNGVTLESDDGEQLHISMRDSGFEVHYVPHPLRNKEPNKDWFEFKNGKVNRMEPI